MTDLDLGGNDCTANEFKVRRQRDDQPCLIHLHIISLVALTNRCTANAF